MYLVCRITREHRENLAKNARMIFNKSREELQEIQNKAVKSVKGKKENFSEDLIFNVQQQVVMGNYECFFSCIILLTDHNIVMFQSRS